MRAERFDFDDERLRRASARVEKSAAEARRHITKSLSYVDDMLSEIGNAMTALNINRSPETQEILERSYRRAKSLRDVLLEAKARIGREVVNASRR